jgi:hypothetical protein
MTYSGLKHLIEGFNNHSELKELNLDISSIGFVGVLKDLEEFCAQHK